MVAASGGWSRVAGGFLNSGLLGPLPARVENKPWKLCLPVTRGPGPGPATAGDRDGERVRDRQRQRDGDRERDGELETER